MKSDQHTVTQAIKTPFGRLNIVCPHTKQQSQRIISEFNYERSVCDDEFLMAFLDLPIEEAESTYRAMTFQNGLYIGHHQGKPANISFGQRSLTISMPEFDLESYRKLFWSYGLKFYLSWEASRHSALHVKATTLAIGNGMLLLVGRGGSGKTTLARAIEEAGYCEVIGNTHAVVKEDWVWALNTWMRSRTPAGQVYLPPRPTEMKGDGPVKRIIIVDYQKGSDFVFRKIPTKQAIGYLAEYFWATNTYDLQEDISDQMSLLDSAELFSREIYQIKRLIDKHGIFYLTFDLNNDATRSKVIDHFRKLAC